MSIKDKLQIFLVTYNRKGKLEETLNTILANNSPINNFDITILDNASTDGSSEMLEIYCRKFSNLTHIRHCSNIGGNANIARAFELASGSPKPYFWILCDDDSFDFRDWSKVEKAVNDNYDVIIVEQKVKIPEKQQIEYLLNTTAFVASAIYKTNLVTNQVLQNMYCNIYVSFPHLACSIHAINEHKKFFIGPKIVIQNVNLEFTRGTNDERHHRITNCNLFSGYINSYQMIKDKKLRYKCCDVLWLGKSFYHSMKAFWKSNKLYPYNAADIFWGISLKQKVIFLLAGLSIILYKLSRFVFQLTNSDNKSHKIITILGLKIKIQRHKNRICTNNKY